MPSCREHGGVHREVFAALAASDMVTKAQSPVLSTEPRRERRPGLRTAAHSGRSGNLHGAGESRLGPIIHLPQLLEELGVRPALVFRRAGVSTGLFANPENRITQEQLFGLLSACVSLTGRSDFGLLLGGRASLENFGALGELMQNSATVGEAMKMLILHLHFFDRGGIPIFIRAESKNVFLGYSLQHVALDGSAPLQDVAITIASRMLRELCGRAWQPLFVQFSHHRPKETSAYRRVFGPGVQFNATLSGLSFSASWLDHRIAAADMARFRALNEALRQAEAGWPISVAEEVQCILHQLLPGGTIASASVARLFGYSDRTLRQKLRSEGTSMQRLLTETRFELARHLLQDTDLSMSRIAAALCYADAAVFSRAFQAWTGMSPRQWRTAGRKVLAP